MNHGMRIRCFGTAGIFLLFLASSALAEADRIRRDSIKHAITIPGAAAVLSNPNRLNADGDPVEIITVGMGSNLGPATYRATGFLHTFSSTDPRDDLVEPLKPRMLRLTPAETWDAYPRARRLGAQVQMVVSDAYGYESGWPGEIGDWSAWESTVSSLVSQAESLDYSDIVWDIWNEPNYDRFWGASTEQFNETWRRGFLTIRSLNPGAIIAGPSATGSIDYVKNFLLYARDNNVLPDIVSFHVLFDEERRIPGYVDDLRSFMAGNGINIQRISINEYDSFDTTGTLDGNVGRHIRLLSNLEKARVDSAAKSSWNDAFLDNVAPDNTKSALWWAYKAYADITGNLVSVDSSATVDGVAGKDSTTSSAHIVLGRHDGAGDDVGVLIDSLDKAAYLVNSGAVHVTADLITSQTYDNALPQRVIDADYPVSNSQVFVVIPTFGPEDAYTLTLSPNLVAPQYDTNSPTVFLTAPADDSTVSGTITVSADASDNVGVYGVQFKLDGAALGVEDATFPYAISWDTTSATGGSYVLTATARDAAGNQTTSPGVTVTVSGNTLPGPVAAYSFDEGSGTQVLDSSGNHNTGILVNNPAWTIGKYGSALAFNRGNYVAIADNPSLNATVSFTLTAWLKRDSLIGDQVIFQQGPTAGNWETSIFDGDNLFGLAKYEVEDVRSSSPILDTGWHHIAIVKSEDAGTNVSLYLDGALKGVASLTGLGASGEKRIGGDAWYNSDFFSGAIDNLRLYARALSQSEIQTDMNTTISGSIP